MKYKIGDKVKTDITNREWIVIATDDRQDRFSKVKVKYKGFFRDTTRWEFESMLVRIIEE